MKKRKERVWTMKQISDAFRYGSEVIYGCRMPPSLNELKQKLKAQPIRKPKTRKRAK
jgi:hypothetical protein